MEGLLSTGPNPSSLYMRTNIVSLLYRIPISLYHAIPYHCIGLRQYSQYSQYHLEEILLYHVPLKKKNYTHKGYNPLPLNYIWIDYPG